MKRVCVCAWLFWPTTLPVGMKCCPKHKEKGGEKILINQKTRIYGNGIRGNWKNIIEHFQTPSPCCIIVLSEPRVIRKLTPSSSKNLCQCPYSEFVLISPNRAALLPKVIYMLCNVWFSGINPPQIQPGLNHHNSHFVAFFLITHTRIYFRTVTSEGKWHFSASWSETQISGLWASGITSLGKCLPAIRLCLDSEGLTWLWGDFPASKLSGWKCESLNPSRE